jgi:hypothetical protein
MKMGLIVLHLGRPAKPIINNQSSLPDFLRYLPDMQRQYDQSQAARPDIILCLINHHPHLPRLLALKIEGFT